VLVGGEDPGGDETGAHCGGISLVLKKIVGVGFCLLKAETIIARRRPTN